MAVKKKTDTTKLFGKRRVTGVFRNASCTADNSCGLWCSKPGSRYRPILRKFVVVTTLGVIFTLIPLLLIVTDPMYIIGKYNFRLANGTVLHEIFSEELECGRFEVFLFNLSNADRFLAGDDDKLSLQEVGPFTYIEYRTHEGLLLKDGLMSFTPRLRSVFVPEESVAYPEDVNITMPNIPLLGAATLLSTSPFMIRSVFNMIVSQFRSRAVVRTSAHEYLWGYREPVLSFAHKLAPGLVHFQTTGIMDRMYDKKEYYHLELGATDEDKFSIKTVKQSRVISSGDQEVITESTASYKDTYEGIAYPPKLLPHAPINILRVGICRSFPMTQWGKTTSQYGPDALVYKMTDQAYGNATLCNSKGFCPKGLMDMSTCYMGLPLALSNGHFLNGDPGLFDRIQGLSPDPTEHSSHIVIEPKIGLTLETKLSLQVNIVLGNLKYNAETRRFSDIVLPIAHFKIRQPRLPEIAVRALGVMYIIMPQVLLAVEIILGVSGTLLLCYSAKLLHRSRNNLDVSTSSITKVHAPLIAK